MVGRTNVGGGGGGGGGGGLITIVAIASLGDTVVISLGSVVKSKTVTSGDSVQFNVSQYGTWTVTNDDFVGELYVNAPGLYEINTTAYIFGIKRLRNVSGSPVWERTDASQSYTATASEGVIAGSSDFDNKPIFKDIRRETLSTGDVMVKIPKFWFQRYVDEDQYEYIRISNKAVDGFSVHPAFTHNGSSQNYIYVGAYKTSAGHFSKSGQTILGNTTRDAFRTGAAAKGNGWGLIDLSTLMAIQTLYLIEFANNDSQTSVGYGVCANSMTNTILPTGGCDNIPNLTGHPAGTNGETQVVWRGIEDLWGNAYEYCDGVHIHTSQLHICNDQAHYADTSTISGVYTRLSYDAPSSGSVGLLGYDSNNPAYMLMSSYTSSYSVGYCDYSALRYPSGISLSLTTGSPMNLEQCGLFAINNGGTGSTSSAKYGSRLLYVPPIT